MDDGNLESTISSSTGFLYILISAVLVNQLFLHLHFPLISSLPLRWRHFIRMISSRITYLLEQSYGSLNRAMISGREPNAPRGGMSRVLGLNSFPGLHAAGYFSGSQGGPTGQDTGTSIHLTGNDEPPGLGNWDNSCYQNSVLQVTIPPIIHLRPDSDLFQGIASLCSIPSYLDGLTSGTLNDLHSSGISIPTVTALREFLKELNSPRNSGRLLWTPSVLKSMSSWQQQDAQEYFSKIVEQLNKELLTAVERLGKRSSSGLRPKTDDMEPLEVINRRSEESGPQQSLERPAHAKADLHSGLHGSSSAGLWPLQNPLEGFLAQRVGCLQCGWSEGLSMIPFICLTLPLGRGRSFDLAYCLDEYTKLEHIEGVECARCTLLRARFQLESLMETSDFENPASLSGNSRISAKDELLQSTVLPRLQAVNSALDEEDFSENTLSNKCKINARNRVTVTKSRQAVIARAPKSLVIHINRSVFDEASGMQTKNYAQVLFPKMLDLGPWCLDFETSRDSRDQDRTIEPSRSLLTDKREHSGQEGPVYQIRAVITHYGRHENGHYICYRKYPTEPSGRQTEQRWWQLSDDEVTTVTEEEVLEQGGVFMLFYDRIDSASHDGTLFADPEIVMHNRTSSLGGHTSVTTELEGSDGASPNSVHFGGEEPSLTSTHLDQFKGHMDLESGPEAIGSGETIPDDTRTKESDHRGESFATNLMPSVPKASPPKAGVHSTIEIQKQSHMAASSISSLVMAN